MIESLGATQIPSFRFATPSGFLGRGGGQVQKVFVLGSAQGKSYETICENIVSRYQTSCLPSPGAPFFCTDDRKPNL